MGKREKTSEVKLTETEKALITETINKTAYYGERAEFISALKRKLKPVDNPPRD